MIESAEVLARVYAEILARRDADPDVSHTASLFAKGEMAIARKMGEEAMETVNAAAKGEKNAIVYESADLLYHLLVLWAAHGIAPGDVFAELVRREGTSGIAEKAARTSS